MNSKKNFHHCEPHLHVSEFHWNVIFLSHQNNAVLFLSSYFLLYFPSYLFSDIQLTQMVIERLREKELQLLRYLSF